MKESVNEMDRKKKKYKELPPDRRVPKILMTYEEASWSIGICKSKLYQMVSEGKLPVVVIGGNTLIRPQDLEELAAKHLTLRNQ